MTFNFDEIIDRQNTDSIKYASWQRKADDILPMWVADMDFKTVPEVTDALIKKSQHGIFGYSDTLDNDYFEVLQNWYSKRFDWNVSSEWLVKTPGVVFSIYAAVRALTNDGEAVIIQQPVYYPFTNAVINTGRKLIVNELIYKEHRYKIDLDDFEKKIIKENVKLFILCSPHNPVGRVWTKEELIAMGEICVRHGVYVVSDEIHADFVYSGNRHTVFAGISPELSNITITCTAPTKTFNLAGLQISNIFISNKDIRRKFINELRKTGYGEPNVMGIVACRAAYGHGEKWLDELKCYLDENLKYMRSFLKDNIKDIHLVEPEGTYLIWVDFNKLGLSPDELNALIVNKARLWLNDGQMFGKGGNGFQRINIACPKDLIIKAMHQLKEAVDSN